MPNKNQQHYSVRFVPGQSISRDPIRILPTRTQLHSTLAELEAESSPRSKVIFRLGPTATQTPPRTDRGSGGRRPSVRRAAASRRPPTYRPAQPRTSARDLSHSNHALGAPALPRCTTPPGAPTPTSTTPPSAPSSQPNHATSSAATPYASGQELANDVDEAKDVRDLRHFHSRTPTRSG
jgi:hypothetical protein